MFDCNVYCNFQVCSALTQSSSMACYLCGVKISKMNDIDFVRSLPVTEENLSFGLSSLHAYIRFFECLLHVAYRLDIKTWRVGLKLSIVQKES